MQQAVLVAIVFSILSLAVVRATNEVLHEPLYSQTWKQRIMHRQLLARQSKKDSVPQNLTKYGISSANDVLYYSGGDSCDHTGKMKEQALRVCDFIGVNRECMATKSKPGIERTFVMGCEGTTCNATSTTKQAKCALQAAGGSFPSDRMYCGIPANYYEVFSKPSPVWTVTDSKDDGLACALALSRGTTLHRQITCVDGEPKFLFMLQWGIEFAPMNATYTCIFENQCTDNSSSTICFQKRQNKEVETSENNVETTNGETNDNMSQSDEAVDLEGGEANILADKDEDPESMSNSQIETCTMHWTFVVAGMLIVLLA